MRRGLGAALALVALGACGGETAAPPTSVVARPDPTIAPPSAPAPEPTDLVGLDEPPPVPDDVVIGGPLDTRAAPAHGCVLVSDAAQPVLEGASAADVLAVDRHFVVAAYVAGSPETLALARIAPGGAPSPLGRVELGGSLDASRRIAPPVLARLGGTWIGVGLVDPSGGVRLARFEVGSPAPAISVVQVSASGADVRYPPALASVDAGTLVAWTEASGTTAHVRVALVDAAGAVAATHDVTPEAGSAAAPVFVDPTLYVVDARAGISVVHRVPFGADGAPGPTTVAQPINLAAEPPAFAVVGTHLGYTAVGNVATRAVGVVTMGSSDRAQALVPGLGYGDALSIDAVPLGASGLFAMEAPSAADASAPHESRLRVVAEAGTMGEPTVITGMTAPRLALSGDVVAVVGRGAAIRWARCAE